MTLDRSAAKTFDRDVLSSQRPVLVVFSLEWSAPCRMFVPIVSEVSAELSDKIQVVEVDAEANADLANRYRLTEFPALMIFRSGQLIASRNGALSKRILQEWIDENV